MKHPPTDDVTRDALFTLTQRLAREISADYWFSSDEDIGDQIYDTMEEFLEDLGFIEPKLNPED